MAIDLDDILASTNVAELLSDSELSDLGSQVVDDYTKDKGSRSEWEKRSADAMKLALQAVEAKNFPFENAANV